MHQTLEDRVIELNRNVVEMLEKWKKLKRSNIIISYFVTLVFFSMLVLTPILAVIGNVGGSVVLGLISIVYFILRVAINALAVYGIATIDTETEKVTRRSRDSYERLGESKFQG